MKISKPDMAHVWAEGGSISIVPNEKISQGWVAEIPLCEQMNFVQNRQDAGIAYLLQQGIPEWGDSVEYQAGTSYVQYLGAVYKATGIGTNKNPITFPDFWTLAFDLGNISPNELILSTSRTLTYAESGRLIPLQGGVTATLPVAVGVTGKIFYFINISASGSCNVVLPTHNSNTNIFGTQNYPIKVGNVSAFLTDGNNWIPITDHNAISNVDLGSIKYFAMSTAPAGYLKANGATLSRTTYANLFSAIGVTFGNGDGSTTFQIPDLRGEVMRGFDDGRGVDIDRVFGSAQGHAIQSHNHYLPTSTGTVDTSALWAIPDATWTKTNVNFNPAAEGVATTYPLNLPNTPPALAYDAIGDIGNFALETRMRNIAMLACIKY